MSGLVQVASGSSTSSLTLAFSNNIGAGHSVVVCVSGWFATAPYGTTVVPGSGSDSYTQGVYYSNYAGSSIWYVLSSQGGYSTITISGNSNSGYLCWAYEISTLTALDQVSSGGSGSSASPWSSGATGTQSTSSDFAVGVGISMWLSGSSIAGPSSGGWTNETAINNITINGAYSGSAVSGYQFLSSSSSVTYSGTASGSAGQYCSACVATFEYSPPALPQKIFAGRQAVKRASFY